MPFIAGLNKLIKICEKMFSRISVRVQSAVMIFRSANDVTTKYNPLDIKIRTCDSEKHLGFILNCQKIYLNLKT